MAMFRTTSKRLRGAPDFTRLVGSACRPRYITSTPSGSWMMNSQGHDATDNTSAAIVGPATDDVATTTELSAMPRPRTEVGYVSRTSAAFTAIIPAAPSPCTARAPARSGRDGASTHPSDATVKIDRPIR
jgi:hypothetical protein